MKKLIFIFLILSPNMLLAEESAIKKNGYRNRNDEIRKVKQKTTYRKIGYEKLSLVENFDYLISTTDKSEDNIEKIAKEIRDKECKKPCNVHIWDDIKAYNLEKQRLRLKYQKIESNGWNFKDKFDAQQNALKEWDNKNYIFEADHFVGNLNFEDNGNLFFYYQYRDWYYKELKKKQ